MKTLLRSVSLACVAVGLALAVAPAQSADKVRLVISQKSPFELYGAEQAQAEGYFKQENLDVEISYATGGADTLQTLITGSQDITTGNGALGVIAAIGKGAPIVILGSNGRGTDDVFWYVPAASPIKSIKDLDGKELAYSRPGSTTHLIGQAILKATGVNAKLVSVGDPSASRTMVMSGQIATAWAPFPANYDLVRKGETRIVVRGGEAKDLQGVTMRVVAANSNWLKSNRDAATRFMRANWKGIEFQYALHDRGVDRYAKAWKLDPQDVRRGPEFSPMDKQTYTPFGHLDQLEKIAMELKMLRAPLSEAQKKAMIDVVWPGPKPKS